MESDSTLDTSSEENKFADEIDRYYHALKRFATDTLSHVNLTPAQRATGFGLIGLVAGAIAVQSFVPGGAKGILKYLTKSWGSIVSTSGRGKSKSRSKSKSSKRGGTSRRASTSSSSRKMSGRGSSSRSNHVN